MTIPTYNTGILDEGVFQPWSYMPHAEQSPASSELELDDIVNDLVRSNEIDEFIRNTCIEYLARFGVTSWQGECAVIKFWCHDCDATFRCHVSVNPLNRNDPPMCLLSVELGHSGRTIYGSLIADLTGTGPLMLSYAVRSILLQALGHDE